MKKTLILLLLLLSKPLAAQCVRTDRLGLSDVAREVLNRIETNATALSYSTVPASRLLSTCNRFVAVKIDGPNIFAAARDMIATANREVDMAFFQWKHDSQAAKLIGDGLIAAQVRRTAATPLLVRIIIDDVDATIDPHRAIDELYDSQKQWVQYGLDLSRVKLQLATSSRTDWLDPNLHDKFIVVDGRQMLITGSQPELHSDAYSSAPESGWHDSGYWFEGDVAQSTLAAFEYSWTNSHATHWECQPESWSYDCDKRSSRFPSPVRTWLAPLGTDRPGDVPTIVVGRKRGSKWDNNIPNPQGIAWKTAMELATSHIHVESPNIGDDQFRASILAAIGRGVTVRLITSLGFNDRSADGVGDDNMTVVGQLRQSIRSQFPQYANNFQVRWYSRDGLEPIEGNASGASHTKYMTTDGRIAIVGSGNQDKIAWDISQEFNVLVDDSATTAAVEASLFSPDWSRSVTSYLELYEGNDGEQNVVCPIAVNKSKSVDFGDPLDGTDYRCDNDEARSMLLHDVPAGKVFRFYDDPYRDYQDDDWTEVIVKRFVSRKYINSFESSWEDDDVRVIHHRDNGLDGKISAAEVTSSPVGAVIDLHEGNGGTQNLVCSTRVVGTRTINLTFDPYCNNDEARSLTLYDFPADKAIFLYDDPGGSQGDDWTVIVPKRTITQATVASFETAYETADLKVCKFPNNGLDGKVSRMRIGAISEAAGICTPTVFTPPAPPTTFTVLRRGTGTGTVTSSPAGINCGPTCTAPFAAGTVITLHAYAPYGSRFAGWSGGGCSGTGTCTVTFPEYASVIANFNSTTLGGGDPAQ